MRNEEDAITRRLYLVNLGSPRQSHGSMSQIGGDIGGERKISVDCAAFM